MALSLQCILLSLKGALPFPFTVTVHAWKHSLRCEYQQTSRVFRRLIVKATWRHSVNCELVKYEITNNDTFPNIKEKPSLETPLRHTVDSH